MARRLTREPTLGTRMKEAARRCGKSGVQIAEEMGVNVVSLRRWWGDSRKPTWQNIRDYARAVGATPEELSGDGERENQVFIERILHLADALMEGSSISEAVEGVTEPGLLSAEQRARLDIATDLFRMALQQALPPGIEWRTASLEERRRAVRLLESLLERPESDRSSRYQ